MGAEAEGGITCRRSYEASCLLLCRKNPIDLKFSIFRFTPGRPTSFLTRSGNTNVHSASCSQRKHTLLPSLSTQYLDITKQPHWLVLKKRTITTEKMRASNLQTVHHVVILITHNSPTHRLEVSIKAVTVSS